MTSPTIALQQALLAYKAGRLIEAERLCQRTLSADRECFEAAHLLAVIQASLGKNTFALDNYDRALALRPTDAELLNNRGVTLHALRRFDEAVASYDRALSARPNYADAHCNRANALQELKRHGEALASYDKALSLVPGHASALYNRGVTLQALRRFDEALASYDRAVSAEPNHAKALKNRGLTLRELRRHDEALASYDRALSVRPNDAEAHNNKGALLKELGRLTEARASIQRAIQLSPGTPLFYLNLATSIQSAPDDQHLVAMQGLAQNLASLSEGQQIALHFALAKALADVNEHDQSFRHLLQGNALKRQQIVYDEAATVQLFQRIQTVFTAELMRDKSGLGDPSDVPIFVVGMPRSGSTLVEQILASHPKVFGAGELDYLAGAIATLLTPLPFPEGISAKSGNWLRRVGESYLGTVTKLAPKAAHITDKKLLNFGFIGLIHLALPHVRIVHIRRDPVDTCLSCFSTLFAAGHPFSYDLGELGRFYHAYEVLMQHWRNVLPDGVMLEVRYEDVVDDLAGQTHRLLRHCGLDWDDACLAFHQTQRPVQTASAVQVRQPIYRSSIGRWRPSNDQLRPLLEGLNFASVLG